MPKNGKMGIEMVHHKGKMTATLLFVYTARSESRCTEDSFSMQATTLITVGSLSKRETVGSGFEEEEERGGRFLASSLLHFASLRFW